MGAGDQGIMFGYASDETEDCMPLTHSIATRLGKKLTDVRKSGDLWWLRPREMQASRAARSSSTPTAVGVPTVVALSLARTQLRWTGPLPTFAGRWPSRW